MPRQKSIRRKSFSFDYYSLTDFDDFVIATDVFGIFIIVIVVAGPSAAIATPTIFTEAHCSLVSFLTLSSFCVILSKAFSSHIQNEITADVQNRFKDKN